MSILSKILIPIFLMGQALLASSPERAIKEVIAELNQLYARSKHIEDLGQDHNIGAQTRNAQTYFISAKKNYVTGEYKAAIDDLNNFLNMTQNNNESQYLQAQYILGQCYQKINLTRKAMRAYNRYISTYITVKDKSKSYLVQVIQNLLNLSTQLPLSEAQKTRELIAALSSLDLPKVEMSRVLFYLAFTSKDQKEYYIADRLFKESMELTDQTLFKAENIYFSALIPLKGGRLLQARDRFKEVLTITDDRAKEYRNFSKLNMARIEAHEGHYKTALSLYNSVEINTAAHEDALFEKVYVHIDTDNYKQADATAQQYLETYQDSEKREILEHMSPYLKLKSEAITETEQAISARLAKITELRTWLNNVPKSSPRITEDDLKNIAQRGNLVSPPPPALSMATRHFQRISKLIATLDDIRSESRSTIYSLGTISPDLYNPSWRTKSDTIAKLAQEAFDISDRILLIEQHSYAKNIDQTMQVQLDRSAQRRKQIKSQLGKLNYQRGRWKFRVGVIKQKEDLENIHTMLQTKASELKGMSYAFKGSPHIHKINHFLKRNQKLQSQITRALEVIQSRSKLDMGHQTVNNGTRRYILDYSQVTHEESTIIDKIRKQYSSAFEQHLSQDITNAWQKWDYVIKHIYELNNKLDQSIHSDLNSGVQNLDSYADRYERHKKELLALKSRLEFLVTKNIVSISAHYDNQISRKAAELSKWQADNQWVNYIIRSRDRKDIEMEHQLKVNEMKEDLRDLEYGVN